VFRREVHLSFSVYKVLDMLSSFEEGDGKGFPEIWTSDLKIQKQVSYHKTMAVLVYRINFYSFLKNNYFFRWKTFSEIFYFQIWYILTDTAEIWTVAGKASWDPANRQQKLRKLAKFLMTTFAYRSSSYLFYVVHSWHAVQ
jgi:hypothetical protein